MTRTTHPMTGLLSPAEREAVEASGLSGHECFIRRWERYGMKRTDAPPEFHRMVALALVAMAVDRRLYLDLNHKRVYPSFYCLVLAESGQRKSTAMHLGMEVARSVFPEGLLSESYSPEALIEDLASRKDARGVAESRGTAFIDEAGGILSTTRARHYGEGLKDLLSRLWDAPEEFSRKLRKVSYDLRSCYVNLMMAATRTRFAELMTREDVTSGFLARYLPVIASTTVDRRPLAIRTAEMDESRRRLEKELGEMRAGLVAEGSEMTITLEALERLDKAEEDLTAWAEAEYERDLLAPWVQRLAEYAIRLSLLFAVSGKAKQVEVFHALCALQIVDRAKEDMQVLVQDMTQGSQARILDRIEQFIQSNPGISGRDVARKTHMKTDQVQEWVKTLEDQGRIRVTRTGTNGYVCHAVKQAA